MVVFKGADRKLYEFLHTKYGTPYIRRLRYDRDVRLMSPKKIESLRNFAIVNIENYGKSGKKWYKGVMMPPSAVEVGRRLIGTKSSIESLTNKEKERLRLWREAFGVTEPASESLFKRIKARLVLALT